jgi:hypothetical protein
VGRGPGWIQRLVESAFKANPTVTYTVDNLAVMAYPNAPRIEKKHRVAVIRAAAAAAKVCGWWHARANRPGHPVVYGNPLDLQSYAAWNMQLDLLRGEDLAAWMQPGGIWWMHVEINKARAVGNDAEADIMTADLRGKVARMAEPLRFAAAA